MADRATLARARKELEDMYLGIPDDSVNLTFGDMAEVTPGPLERKKSGPLELDNKVKTNQSKNDVTVSVLTTIPSLDFSRALEATAKVDPQHRFNSPVVGHPFADKQHLSHLSSQPRHQMPHHQMPSQKVPSHQPSPYRESPYDGMSIQHQHHHMSSHQPNPYRGSPYDGMSIQNPHASHQPSPYRGSPYDGMSMASVEMSGYNDGGKGRRPGIPHSNICTICSNSIYMCRHRCLVCGRAYCKQCLRIGMGDMTEGRKCLECVGKKFSPRYIHKAGQVSCCMRLKYSTEVVQQELKWAEKGPRKKGEKRYGQSVMSTSRKPLSPRTSTRPRLNQETMSFVASSQYSPYSSPTNHALPF